MYFIFRGLLELGKLYEGSPITEEIFLESELILDKINNLETNNVIDDLIDMKLDISKTEQLCDKSNDCCTFNNLQSLNLNDEQTNSSYKKATEGIFFKYFIQFSRNFLPFTTNHLFIDFFEDMITEKTTHQTISSDQLQKLLLSSPELKNILQESEQILEKLGWQNDLYTILV